MRSLVLDEQTGNQWNRALLLANNHTQLIDAIDLWRSRIGKQNPVVKIPSRTN